MPAPAELSAREIWIRLLLYPSHTLPTAAAPVLVGVGLAIRDGVFSPLPMLVGFLRPYFGGAVDPGESYEDAARRELIEETGIHADPGPEIFKRVVEFVTLEGVPVLADERYFLIRTDIAEIDTSRHTDLEQRVMQHWQWFDRDSIAAHHELIYPEDLAQILSGLNGAVS